MIDRAKLVERLEKETIVTDAGYVEVPFFLFNEIVYQLKEQEAKEAKYVGHDGVMNWECPRCKNLIDMIYDGEQVNYCHFCGQKISFYITK